jgi:uncharacterized membrane protein HdeD (DUF308 family)
MVLIPTIFLFFGCVCVILGAVIETYTIAASFRKKHRHHHLISNLLMSSGSLSIGVAMLVNSEVLAGYVFMMISFAFTAPCIAYCWKVYRHQKAVTEK